MLAQTLAPFGSPMEMATSRFADSLPVSRAAADSSNRSRAGSASSLPPGDPALARVPVDNGAEGAGGDGSSALLPSGGVACVVCNCLAASSCAKPDADASTAPPLGKRRRRNVYAGAGAGAVLGMPRSSRARTDADAAFAAEAAAEAALLSLGSAAKFTGSADA